MPLPSKSWKTAALPESPFLKCMAHRLRRWRPRQSRQRGLELATGIAIGLTRSPFETAVTSLDLDHLSKGRFILGLGTGPKHWTNGYFGMPYDKPVSRLREVVQILRHVEDGARSGEMQPWEGQFYQLQFDAYQPTLPPYRETVFLSGLPPCASACVN